MAKHTALYNEHVKLGAKMVEFAGWEMPVQYAGVVAEHLTVRKAAGLFDVSHMGVFEIKGSGALEFLNYLTPGDMNLITDNQAQYSLLLTEKGTIIDDILVYRITQDRFFMVVNASNLEKDHKWIESHLTGGVELTDQSADYTLMALQGPKAASILGKLIDINLDDIKTFHVATGNIKGIGETMIARTGYTGEDGFEMFAPAEKAAELWNLLLESGSDAGLKPVGLGARDTLRLEMKYTLYGHEITEETNALEAGLRWVIKFKKASNFIGKDALVKIKEEGTKRRLVGFKMVDRGIPRQGYIIKSGGREIGVVTSGTLSPSLDIPIGIGYVEEALGEPGSKIFIDIRGKERLAEVAGTPFYRK